MNMELNYNISEIDLVLKSKMLSPEGAMVKDSLIAKISELEQQLRLFQDSIAHCNKQIEEYHKLEIEDPERESVYCDKIVAFENNRYIWNLSGFITLLSIDIKTLQIGLYFSENEWQKRHYARYACTLMYEGIDDIFELIGKDFKTLLSTDSYKVVNRSLLISLRTKLNEFKNDYCPLFRNIRNNTFAHMDHDVASQVKTICEINWSDTIKALQLFEGIINDMGVFMKQLIDLGRKQLESVYSHNE